MYRHTLVNNFLEYSAARLPDKVALIHQDRRMTYAEIDSMANSLAYALVESGIESGDRVAIFLDNSVEMVISIFAILKAGAVFMPVNHTIKTAKLSFILDNSSAKAVITRAGKLEMFRNVNSRYLNTIIVSDLQEPIKQPTGMQEHYSVLSFDDAVSSPAGNIPAKGIDLDLASIIYTSGSSGAPKGVMLSHLNMLSAAHSISSYLGNNEEDIIFNTLPLSFDYGLYQILMGFRMGATVVLDKSFAYPSRILNTIITEKVTGFPGVPTLFALLFQMKDITRYRLDSVRYVTNTAAALPENYIKRIKKIFPSAKIYSMYGLTECKRVSFLPPEDLDTRPTSVGKGMPNEEVYIVNEKGESVGPGQLGELVVRGSNVMLGYWEMPDETAQVLRPGKYPGERVLYTGDLFRKDRDGYLYFVARKDDIIKFSGEKVSPKEIENVLCSLDGVLEAAVVGIPDSIYGQVVMAYVVLEDGSGLTERDILKHCSHHLELSMLPRHIEITKSLPLSENGKISKIALLRKKRPAIYARQSLMIHSFLSKWASECPSKIAVIQGERRVTYAELNLGVNRLASFLRKTGFQKGERVAIMSENSPEYIISYLGAQKAGGICVDINPQYSANEAARIINNSAPSILIVEVRFSKMFQKILAENTTISTCIVIGGQERRVKGFIEKISLPANVDCFSLDDILAIAGDDFICTELNERDICSIVYTSGTTGEPKGVMLSHKNFMANASSIVNYLGLTFEDRVMAILPFCYSYGKSLLTTHILAGGSMVLEKSFMYPNVILDKMRDEEVTGFAGVPSTYSILLNRSNIRNYEFPALRYVTQAGGPMPPKHVRELTEILAPARVFVMYGQTEATARLTYLSPADLERKSGSIGKAIPGVEIELIREDGLEAGEGETGEIVATGDSIMSGYWNNPDETRKVMRKGRLHTGDLAVKDDEGYLYIVGRRSDMIKSGAHRISPKEIEEIILELHEVHEVAVIGIDDEILGQAIKAVIVLKKGAVEDVKMIQKHCSLKLAAFKIPKTIQFAAELPRTVSGKVRKFLLQETAQG